MLINNIQLWLLFIAAFAASLVGSSQSDCLRTSYPQLVGANTGHTYINVIILDSTTSATPNIYMGGQTSAPALSAESSNSYSRPFIRYLSGTTSATLWQRAIVTYNGSYKYTAVTAMRKVSSYLWAVLKPQSSSHTNLLVKILASNGYVMSGSSPYGQIFLQSKGTVTNDQFLHVYTSSRNWFITGSSHDTSNYVRFETHTDSTSRLYYDSSARRYRYYYEREYTIRAARRHTNFQNVLCMIWDSTNSQMYAAVTLQSYHHSTYYTSAAIATFSYDLGSKQKIARGEANHYSNYNAWVPSILTWESGERVIGMGSVFNDHTRTQINDNYQRFFIEKTVGACDYFWYFQVNTYRTRTFSYLDYQRSGKTVTVAVFDSQNRYIWLQKVVYTASSPYNIGNFGITFTEAKVHSYCSSNSNGCYVNAVAWGTGQAKGSSQEYFFYAGNKQKHFTSYSYQIGFVSVRTDSRLQCWDRQWASDDSLSFTDRYGSSLFRNGVSSHSNGYLSMYSSTFSWYFNSRTYSDSSTIYSKAVTHGTSTNQLTAYSNTASSHCVPWTDDYFYPYNYASLSVTNSYTLYYNGRSEALSLTMRSNIFRSILAQQGCGQRTVTYSWVKKSGDIPSTQTIYFDNSQEGKISTDAITWAKMNNMSTATNVYDVTYTVSATPDSSYQSGTNVATRTIEWTLTLINRCYTGASPSPYINPPYSTNALLWSEYFNDQAPAKLVKNFKNDVGSFTLNHYCEINTQTLYESDCSTAIQVPDNFRQLTGTLSGHSLTFEMNIDPTALYDTYYCLKVNNYHSLYKQRNFRVRVICGHNSHYTLAMATTMAPDSGRQREFYIDTTGNTYTYDDFTSTGDRLCPVTAYQVYNRQHNSYPYYSGITVSGNGLSKVVSLADYRVASNLNTYQFYVRSYFSGGAYKFSDVITFKIVCGTETLSLAQTSGGVDQSIYYFNDQGWKWKTTLDEADLWGSIDNSAYQSHFLSDKSLCPIDEWEIWQDNGNLLWDDSSLIKVAKEDINGRIKIDGYDQGKTYQLGVSLQNGLAVKHNYYNKFRLRGFTKSRHNALRPKTNQIDYWVYIDICGWETVIDPEVPDTTETWDKIRTIKPKTSYYVEVGMNRSNTENFTDYTTDSTLWPTWHPDTGKRQCDITNYDLTTDTTSHTIYPPQLNTEATYYKQLRTWDEPTRKYLIDTADNTTKLGTETFYVRVKTRGNRYYYYPIETTIQCGNETIYTPPEVKIFTVQQNTTYEFLSYTVKGFWSDCPRLCNITKFTLEKVVDENNRNVSQETIGTKFQVNRIGNFTLLDASETFNHYIIYMSAESDTVKSATVHALNVTVVPFYSTNTNKAPVFSGVDGLEFDEQIIYIDHHYSKTPFVLPPIVDFNGDGFYVFLEQGRERPFVEYDNSTKSFNYMKGKIPENLRGSYKVKILLGDDNWLGPLTNTYTLRFRVTDAPKPIIIAAPVDTSSKGAKVKEMSITGEVEVGFKDPCYINIEKLRRKRLLEAVSTVVDSGNASTDANSTSNSSATNATEPEKNTTWVIHEKAEELPPIPVDLNSLSFPKELIDDRVFDVYVDPSPYQDVTKVNLTWMIDTLTADDISFQVFYDHPEYISQEGLDTLVIKIKDRSIFLSQKDGKQIFNDGFEIREKIRKQLPPPSKQGSDDNLSIDNLQYFIDSELYEQAIEDAEYYSKMSILGILAWSFFSGAKNLDFLWSYLGVLQIFTHIPLIRIQIPMNVILFSKAFLSVSVFDFRDLQERLLKLTPLSLNTYVDQIIAIIDAPQTKYLIKDVKSEISQYQFFEHGYKETDSFFQNLRSMQVLLAISIAFWGLAFVLYILSKVIPPLGRHWIFRGLWIRCWNYMGPNAIIRILTLEFILVLFAGFTVFRKELFLLVEGGEHDTSLTTEMYVLAGLITVPLFLALIIPCCSKDMLRKPFIEISMNTLYYKSNLRDCASKAYPLLLIFQRLAVAAVVFFIEEIVIQLEVLVLVNLFISWLVTSVDYIYLDKHLKTFERINQGFLSVLQVSLVLFTDYVDSRQVQFNIGYMFAGMILVFNTISLGICLMYALEPLTTWIRMRYMRLEQLRLAEQLRATLIREAKERKEERKQRKLNAFNSFKIDLGVENEANTEDDETVKADSPTKIGNKTAALDSIAEEQWEDTQNGSVAQKDELAADIDRLLNELEKGQPSTFGKKDDLLIEDEELKQPQEEDEDEDKFDETPYRESLDKMGLMDRTRYIDIMKRNQQLKKLREELVFADLDDDGTNLSKSKKAAKDLHKKHKEPLSKKSIKKERKKIEQEKEEETKEETKDDQNIEYWSYINAIDSDLEELDKELRQIEEANGIYARTRDTWLEKEPGEEDRVNILDVFAVEIEN